MRLVQYHSRVSIKRRASYSALAVCAKTIRILWEHWADCSESAQCKIRSTVLARSLLHSFVLKHHRCSARSACCWAATRHGQGFWSRLAPQRSLQLASAAELLAGRLTGQDPGNTGGSQGWGGAALAGVSECSGTRASAAWRTLPFAQWAAQSLCTRCSRYANAVSNMMFRWCSALFPGGCSKAAGRLCLHRPRSFPHRTPRPPQRSTPSRLSLSAVHSGRRVLMSSSTALQRTWTMASHSPVCGACPSAVCRLWTAATTCGAICVCGASMCHLMRSRHLGLRFTGENALGTLRCMALCVESCWFAWKLCRFVCKLPTPLALRLLPQPAYTPRFCMTYSWSRLLMSCAWTSLAWRGCPSACLASALRWPEGAAMHRREGVLFAPLCRMHSVWPDVVWPDVPTPLLAAAAEDSTAWLRIQPWPHLWLTYGIVPIHPAANPPVTPHFTTILLITPLPLSTEGCV